MAVALKQNVVNVSPPATVANVAGAAAALFQADCDLLKRSLTDKITEPDRSILISHFNEMKVAVKISNEFSRFKSQLLEMF